MPGLFGILEIGKRTLISQQIAQSVIGNNIANVNTEGYSRQKVALKQIGSIDTPWGTIGMGVQINSIERSRDALLDRLYREAQGTSSEWQTRAQFMSEIDVIFTEVDGAGIGTQLDQFFNAWHELANSPEDQRPRIALRERGIALTETFHRIANKLKEQKQQINTRIQAISDKINEILKKIADLNSRIPSGNDTPGRANELLDQRDKLLDELAQYVDVQTFERQDQGVAVYIGSTSLVEGSYYRKMSTTTEVLNDLPITKIIGPDGEELSPSRGELKGLMELRDEIIPTYEDRLNELARTVVEQVNNYHKVGYTLDGETGYQFFDNRHITASNISLDAEILKDPGKIVAAATDAAGDNTQAQRIAALKDMPLIDGSSLREFYATLVTRIGIDGQTANDFSKNHEIVAMQATLQREQVMGVSLDEEMVDMIKYQQSYLAATRMITTVDQMIEAVLNMR